MGDGTSGMLCCKRSSAEKSIRHKGCCGDQCEIKAQNAESRSGGAFTFKPAIQDEQVLVRFSIPFNSMSVEQAGNVYNQVVPEPAATKLWPPDIVVLNHSFRN